MFIAICSPKGGVGKTTVAVTLASYLRGDIAFLDSDPIRSGSRWITRFTDDIPCIQVDPSDDPRGSTLKAARRIMKESKNIIADSPPSSVEVIRVLLGLADLVVIPTGATVEEIHLAKKTLEMAKEEGIMRREEIPCLLIFTRINPRTIVGREALELASSLEIPVARTRVQYRTAWIEAMSEGIPIHDMGSRAGDAIQEANSLCEEIIRYARGEQHGTKKQARGQAEGA